MWNKTNWNITYERYISIKKIPDFIPNEKKNIPT